jgi:hypothetical protein
MLAVDHRRACGYLSGLDGDARLAVLHLLGCPACRETLEREVGAQVREQLRGTLAGPAPAAGASSLASGAASETMAGRVVAAAAVVGQLDTLPVEEWRLVVSQTEPELQPLVARALVLRAADSLDEPPRAETLAELAFEILAPQEVDPEGRQLALLLRASWLLVRARLRLGKLQPAEDAYRRALPFLGSAAGGVGDERAALCCALAQLRWHQRRLDEAASHFLHAARIFAAAAERQAEVACRVQGAFVLLEQGLPALARVELSLAHAHVDAEVAPALAARIALALAHCNAELGFGDQARERLRGARGLYAAAPAAGEEVFRAWWEARLAARDGQLALADEQLDAVRRRLLAEGSLGEAALCALDLLVLRVHARRLDDLSHLGPDIFNAFQPSTRALHATVLIDWLAVEAARGEARFAPAAAAIRHHLHSLRPRSGDRPNLVPDLDLLADRLLVRALCDTGASASEETPVVRAGPFS